uniref:Protein kinase domain-containing protein n=1 Tax=Trichobilharzia regenti TaxID=157069 RepID=A0AA85JKR9_TRIRE|nr:unnamed protein product [Trichobilharzia regenti]
MSADRIVRLGSSKSRSGSGEYEGCKKHSSSVSQSEVSGFKVEDTNICTSESEKNGKHVKSDSRDSDFDHDAQLRHGSLSSPVKQSGLPKKLLHPAQFERSNLDDHNKIISGTHHIKSESSHSSRSLHEERSIKKSSQVNKHSTSTKHKTDLSSSHSTENTTHSTHNRSRIGSNSLVPYISTDDELPHDNKNHSYPKRKMRRKDDDAVLPKSYALPESNATNLNSSLKGQTSEILKSVKVIKSTARSTWDSSDSDFDSTVVRTEKASESENTIPVYNHTSNLSSSSRKTSHSTANKLSSSRKSKSNPTTKRKNDTYSKDDSVNSKEARSKLSSSDSDYRRRERNSNRQRSSKRRRKSVSSRASDGSRGTHRAKNTADDISPNHKRSLSHGSSSYHSSMSRSQYSSRTESSCQYDRRKRSYLKSKTYSSRSSAGTSRSYRSSYSSRSRSNSARTPRYRRHVRSSYRRRHRHRSYSVRSRSRSRSSHSTDSSFSSQSSRSSPSRYFSRRNVSKKRSSSRRSRTPLYRPSSSFKKVSDDHVRSTPERRVAHLGSNLDDKTNSPYGDSKPKSYIPSINETVSAAVKRVLGDGQSKNQKISHESTISKNDNCTTESNSANNSKLADEYNSDSRSQPSTSSNVTESNDKTFSPPVLVDIPLPQDALHQSSDNSNNNSNNSNKSATCIGPQVSADLAKRFGLSVADTTVKSETTDSIATVSSSSTTVVTSESSQLQNTSNSSCDTVSSSATKNTDTEVTSANPPEFTIPPEQAELYRRMLKFFTCHCLNYGEIYI